MAAYLMQASFSVTDFEIQMIKLDESAEQLKEATEVTFSRRKTCAKFVLIQNSSSLKFYYSMLLVFYASSLA